MRHMPSFGSRDYLATAERADEYFVLLSDDAAHQIPSIRTLRNVLAADPAALTDMVATDEATVYDALRNLQEYAGALSRLTDVALERFREAVTRNSDRAKFAANGAVLSAGMN